MSKVLHIIENFNGQSTERWLFEVMRHLVGLGEKINWTFYATLGRPGTMDNSVRALGANIIYSPAPLKKKLNFLRELRKSIDQGNYDILHSHHDILSAAYLLASAGLPLKRRIIHVHNTSFCIPTTSTFKNALLREPMRRVCLSWADKIVGVSSVALDSFLDNVRPEIARDMIIHCGIDLAPFRHKPLNHLDFLKALEFPDNSKVLLFVGRMTEYKNPCFVIEILAHVLKFDSTICAVFAGSGPLQDRVLAMAKHESLESRVRVLGWHENIPSLLQSCDILIWPGLEVPREGLGLAVVEAQAAGLPVIMSMSVPKEAIVVPELVEILPLAAGASIWAFHVLTILNRKSPNREKALELVENSSFSIAKSADRIQKLYEM